MTITFDGVNELVSFGPLVMQMKCLYHSIYQTTFDR